MKGLALAIAAIVIFDLAFHHGVGIQAVWHGITELFATIHRGVWAEP